MSKLTRRADWERQLFAYIEQRRAMPFAWGAQDCCQFARGALIATCGLDPAKGWKLRPYKRCGVRRPHCIASAVLEMLPVHAGLIEVGVTRVHRAGIVLCRNEGKPALGVCLGEVTAAPGAHGLEFLPTLAQARAWNIA